MSEYITDPTTGKSIYTFKNGLKVEIVRVAPLLTNQLRKQLKKPIPPKVKIEVGENEFIFEDDIDNAGYKAALEIWSEEIENRARILYLTKGINIDLTPGQRQEVDQLRAFWLENYGDKLEGSDEYCYLSYVAIQSESEYQELISAITGRSEPKESGVANALADFPNHS